MTVERLKRNKGEPHGFWGRAILEEGETGAKALRSRMRLVFGEQQDRVAAME